MSTSTGLIKDNEVGIDTFGDSDDAESTTTRSVGRATDHLVDFVLGRINCTRETVASVTVTLDSYAPIWHFIFERGCFFQINGVPAELDEGLAIVIDVGSCHVRRPIAYGAVFGAPYAGFSTSSPRRIDIVANQPSAKWNAGEGGLKTD